MPPFRFNEISDVAEMCILVCFPFPMQKLLVRGMTGFIMVYKLINGIFNSVHKFTVSTYTGKNETIILDQIIKSKDKDILLRLDSSEQTDPLKAGFLVTTALVRLPHSYLQLFPSHSSKGLW